MTISNFTILVKITCFSFANDQNFILFISCNLYFSLHILKICGVNNYELIKYISFIIYVISIYLFILSYSYFRYRQPTNDGQKDGARITCKKADEKHNEDDKRTTEKTTR